MCGISAIYKCEGERIQDSDLTRLVAMNSAMSYRGPDGVGYWNDKCCAFAHTRLSIIGLSNGKQPLFNEDKSIVLICNGEIYNYLDLKRFLLAREHQFSTDSDCECIIHLYEDFGVGSLAHLRGMFAFCLYDVKEQRLFAARDRVGEKPLYYSQVGDTLVFSSELKAIRNNFRSTQHLAKQEIVDSIGYSYPVSRENTFINEIKRLVPGYFLLAEQCKVTVKCYWEKKSDTTFSGTLEEARNIATDLLEESIRISLQSDVPVAVLLSGGIDSSTIAALAKESHNDVHVITAGYKGKHDCDEREIAKRFAKEKGLTWHEIELSSADYENTFEEYVEKLDEPVCDIAAFAQWNIYKKARAMGFKVLLSGNGSDELFFGYPSHNQRGDMISFLDKLSSLPALRKIPFCVSNHDKIGLLFSLWWHERCGWGDFSPDFYLQNTYSQYFNKQLKHVIESMPSDWGYARQKVILNAYDVDSLYDRIFQVWLPNNCLYLADRLGMGNSVEVRSPFVDYRLVDFVSSLPADMRYSSGQAKYFLRSLLRNVLPDYILNGVKRGFTPPQDFIEHVVQNYQYKFFKGRPLCFNSVLTDRVLSQLDIFL